MTQIVHLAERQRWEAQDDAGSTLGYLSYELSGEVVDLRHTVVQPAARGRGLGGQLVEAALQHARAHGLRVRPTCPFVPAYLADHLEHADLVEGSDGAAPGGPASEGDGDGEVGTMQVQDVPIRDESIRLGQLLKLAGVVPDGAMARMVIEHGEVTVDGATVTRRGTQVRPGQVVEYSGERLTVSADT